MYRNPDDNSIEGIKERMQVMDDRRRAEQNNYSGLPSPFGTLSGAERDQYIAGLTQPKQDASSPAGRFASSIFNTQPNPQYKIYDTNRKNALQDQARVQEQFKDKSGLGGLFEIQTPEEYENSQKALNRARENVLSAQKGEPYVPPDIHGGGYKPEVINLQTPSQGRMSPEYEPSVLGGMGMSPEYEPSTKAPASSTGGGSTSSSGSDSSGGSSSNVGSGSKGGERQKSEYDLIREDIMSQREELKRQKQEDKYMAIIQAGLGMMAGTSPNAFANIGQGASAGIAQYGASGKQRAAEIAALNKGLINAQRYKSMDDYQRAAIASRESGKTADLAALTSAKAEALDLKTTNWLQSSYNHDQQTLLKLMEKFGGVNAVTAKTTDPAGYERAIKNMAALEAKMNLTQRALDKRMMDANPELVKSLQPSGDRKPIAAWDQ